jgi:hypothetical protein
LFCFLVSMYFYDIAFMFPFFLDVRFDCYNLVPEIIIKLSKRGSTLFEIGLAGTSPK